MVKSGNLQIRRIWAEDCATDVARKDLGYEEYRKRDQHQRDDREAQPLKEKSLHGGLSITWSRGAPRVDIARIHRMSLLSCAVQKRYRSGRLGHVAGF